MRRENNEIVKLGKAAQPLVGPKSKPTRFVYLCMILFVYSMLMQGCATKPRGEVFKPITDIKNGESIVYIYCPWDVNRAITDFTVKANGEHIGKLALGVYIPFRSSSQEVLIETHLNFKLLNGAPAVQLLDIAMAKATKIMVDTVQDGNPVFVRCKPYYDRKNHFSPGVVNRLKLAKVSPETGEFEIQYCRLLK